VATHTVKVRCSEVLMARLDELAAAYGGNRSRAIRAAVVQASVAARGESPIMDYDELLRTLGVLAQQGSITAIK
jgi:predicted transcriptional regulator